MGTSAGTLDDDAFELARLYKYLRVVDVCDAMDGIGYFNIGLMDTSIRPLWPGMKFWGAAFTIRCVPANRPMWKLNTTEEIVAAHSIWFNEVGHISYEDHSDLYRNAGPEPDASVDYETVEAYYRQFERHE